jgi:hypothetical protein
MVVARSLAPGAGVVVTSSPEWDVAFSLILVAITPDALPADHA